MDLPVNYDNLTAKQRREVRLQYIKLQDNKCFYCKESLSLSPHYSVTNYPIDWSLFPPGFLRNPIHLQHSHKTGMTEGAVHSYCNAFMWQYENR